jgi:hypothetical protein
MQALAVYNPQLIIMKTIQGYSREGYFWIFILPQPTIPMAVTTKSNVLFLLN